MIGEKVMFVLMTLGLWIGSCVSVEAGVEVQLSLEPTVTAGVTLTPPGDTVVFGSHVGGGFWTFDVSDNSGSGIPGGDWVVEWDGGSGTLESVTAFDADGDGNVEGTLAGDITDGSWEATGWGNPGTSGSFQVPEPATAALLAPGLAFLCRRRSTR